MCISLGLTSKIRSDMQKTYWGSLSVHSGCYKQKYHWLGDLNIYFSVLEAGKSKIKAQTVSSESPLPGSYMAFFLLCSPMTQRVRELSEVPFLRALIPFMRAPPSLPWPNHLPNWPWKLGFQCMNFEETQTFQFMKSRNRKDKEHPHTWCRSDDCGKKREWRKTGLKAKVQERFTC